MNTQPFGSAYLVSPCSSAPFRWGRRSCLGLRTGVSPHFSMNSMREILALRGGYERGRVPLPSPMPPESGALPNNTHPSMIPPRHPSRRPCPLFFVLTRHHLSRPCLHRHVASDRSALRISHRRYPFFRGPSPLSRTPLLHQRYHPTRGSASRAAPRSRAITRDE